MTERPQTSIEQRSRRNADHVRLRHGRIRDTYEDWHGCLVAVTDGEQTTEIPAAYAVPNLGDVTLPSKKDYVLVAEVEGRFPIVLCSTYGDDDESVPDVEKGERVVGNETGAAIRLTPTGDVRITVGDDSKVLLADESGSTQPVARSGDAVSVNPDTGEGTITEGSSNVESA